MKEKILAALKTKYSNLGFGAKALDGVASILEKSVTDESQIETAVGGVEPFLKVFQSNKVDLSQVLVPIRKGKSEAKYHR